MRSLSLFTIGRFSATKPNSCRGLALENVEKFTEPPSHGLASFLTDQIVKTRIPHQAVIAVQTKLFKVLGRVNCALRWQLLPESYADRSGDSLNRG